MTAPHNLTLWHSYVADQMRRYYEATRPLTFWEKLFGRPGYEETCEADELMLGLMMIVLDAKGIRDASVGNAA